MRQLFAGLLMCCLVSTTSLAEARDDALSAVKRLADASGYSWNSNTEGGMGRGGRATEGKTLRDGLTMLKMQMREQSVEAYFKGTVGAVKTEDGWMNLEEASRPDDSGRPGPGMFVAMTARGFKPPATMLTEVVEKATDFTTVDDGSIRVVLPEDAVKGMIQPRRRGGADGDMPQPDIRDAKGTLTLWRGADGELSKAQFEVSGVMSFNGEDRDIDRRTTVELKDVGTTTIDLPPEAAAKMAP
jgi:hypothetical protein